MNRKISVTVVIVLLGLLSAGSVLAKPSNTFGARAGFGLEPDQFVSGLQSRMGEVLPKVRLAPSFDLGFGNNVTTFSGNADLLLGIRPPKSATAFYLGGGPTITVIDRTGGSDTEIGVSAVGGLMIPMGLSNHYNLEIRLGIGDIPEFRFLLGIFLGSQKR